MRERPIAIYDSGIGGITVFKELQKKLPNEKFIYFADNKNLPYGDKSPEQIILFSRNIISYFQEEIKAKLIVAACHTSSALAVEVIKSDFNIPIIGTIFPTLKSLLNSSAKKVGIISTYASAKSHMHEKIFFSHGFRGEIFSIACPEFVPLIEEDNIDMHAIENYAKEYLEIFRKENLDTLIYGCTHYPFIKSVIENILPESILYIDPAKHIADEVAIFLLENNILNLNTNITNVDFYCSGSAVKFKEKLNKLHKVSF